MPSVLNLNNKSMEFAIIQAICRTAICNKNDAIVHQVTRLRDYYKNNGKEKESKIISDILDSTKENPNLRIVKS